MQPYALLLQSSEVTVGKYLSKDLYLFYTGQVVASSIDNTNEFNFNHSVGLEYRFLQNLLVEFEYYRENFRYYQMYTDKLYLEDFKIRLRHSFAF
jgi:opacity protein-like surface antigen